MRSKDKNMEIQPSVSGGEKTAGGTDRDGGKEFRTFLYIRTNPLDTGAEPLAAGLDFWVSPDITVTPPGGSPGDLATGGVMNVVDVVVRNDGGVQAINATVDLFLADPSTAFTPVASDYLGTSLATIGGNSSANVPFSWTPTAQQSGHRCLLARVNSPLTGDGVVDMSIFDVVGDRHVAQRNIHVIPGAQMKKGQFRFLITNPSKKAMRVAVAARSLDLKDRMLQGLTELLHLKRISGCIPARFNSTVVAKGKVAEIRKKVPLGFREEVIPSDKRGTVFLKEGDQLAPDEAIVASVGVELDLAAPTGSISIIEFVQTAVGSDSPIGGLWLVVTH